MPAKSKSQQRFMGMVHAVQKGKMKSPSKNITDVAASMTKEDSGDFARTKHKGLPERKEAILKLARLQTNFLLLKEAGAGGGNPSGSGSTSLNSSGVISGSGVPVGGRIRNSGAASGHASQSSLVRLLAGLHKSTVGKSPATVAARV